MPTPANTPKEQLFQTIAQRLHEQGLRVDRHDPTRPWGGFFVLDESQAQQFADLYFNGLEVDKLRISGQLSPKVLLVAPHQRLSWQYHHRRAEIWQVVEGPVGVAISDTDEQTEVKAYQARRAHHSEAGRAPPPGGPQWLGRGGRNLAAHRCQSAFGRGRHCARAGRFWPLGWTRPCKAGRGRASVRAAYPASFCGEPWLVRKRWFAASMAGVGQTARRQLCCLGSYCARPFSGGSSFFWQPI